MKSEPTKKKGCCQAIRDMFQRVPRNHSIYEQTQADKCTTIGPIIQKAQYNQDLNKKKLLLLDLDETLLYSSTKELHSTTFQIRPIIDGQLKTYYVSLRGGAKLFIQKMSLFYEIGIFTASPREYANSILEQLDPDNQITERYYKEHCVLEDKARIKDLKVLNFDLKNSPVSFSKQPENGLLIKSYFAKKPDRVLEKMIPVLIKMHSLDDIRPVQQNFLEHRINLKLQGELTLRSDRSNNNSERNLSPGILPYMQRVENFQRSSRSIASYNSSSNIKSANKMTPSPRNISERGQKKKPSDFKPKRLQVPSSFTAL